MICMKIIPTLIKYFNIFLIQHSNSGIFPLMLKKSLDGKLVQQISLNMDHCFHLPLTPHRLIFNMSFILVIALFWHVLNISNPGHDLVFLFSLLSSRLLSNVFQQQCLCAEKMSKKNNKRLKTVLSSCNLAIVASFQEGFFKYYIDRKGPSIVG